MEKCFGKQGFTLCSCAFEDGEFVAEKWLNQLDHIETFCWILQYSTLASEPGRRLCRIGKCQVCGKLYCESTDIPEEKSGDSFFTAVYRWFFQQSFDMKPEYQAGDIFRKEFFNLFKECDRAEVEEWLALPENQQIGQMYRN